MKSKLILFFVLAQSLTVLASRDCDEKVCQHERTLETLKERVSDLSLSNEQDQTCPSGGVEVLESSQVFEGSLLKAQGILLQIQGQINAEQKKTQKDNSKCGECEQKNLVSTVSVSRPKNPTVSSMCENRSTEAFSKEFSTVAEAGKYTKAVLDGRNQEGQVLRGACPDPCSYYVYTGETLLPNNQVRLNLVVRCGQPRGSLFATYQYSGALVHQWTCAKK